MQPALNGPPVQRARAMVLCACCANPRCTKLTGDSEAGLKGRR